MANPHGTPIWYELLTADPAGSKTFYDAVVGWTIEPRATGPMDYRMIDTGTGLVGGTMTLSPEMQAGGARPGWLFYVGVDDVDSAAQAAHATGGSVAMPPMTLDGVGRMALLADPHGARFYVMRGASDEASTAFQSAEHAVPGHAVWNELSARDGDAAIAFYAGLVGWRQEGAMPMGDLGDYRFLHVGDTAMGAVMGEVPGGEPGWLFYFMVPDIDAAHARIAAAGGSVVQEPVEIPGGSYSLVARDPEGSRFGLVGPRHPGERP